MKLNNYFLITVLVLGIITLGVGIILFIRNKIKSNKKTSSSKLKAARLTTNTKDGENVEILQNIDEEDCFKPIFKKKEEKQQDPKVTPQLTNPNGQPQGQNQQDNNLRNRTGNQPNNNDVPRDKNDLQQHEIRPLNNPGDMTYPETQESEPSEPLLDQILNFEWREYIRNDPWVLGRIAAGLLFAYQGFNWLIS